MRICSVSRKVRDDALRPFKESEFGVIHVYTGNGKGKTTAALGLALRAAGAGFKVYIGQFIKGRKCSELKAIKKFKNIKLEQFGTGCFIKKELTQKDIEFALSGFKKIRKVISGKKYNLVILDEVNLALALGLLPQSEAVSLFKKVPAEIELILTGRNAPKEILKIAHLVSEIKEKKHYYKNGVKAREGIEF